MGFPEPGAGAGDKVLRNGSRAGPGARDTRTQVWLSLESWGDTGLAAGSAGPKAMPVWGRKRKVKSLSLTFPTTDFRSAVEVRNQHGQPRLGLEPSISSSKQEK